METQPSVDKQGKPKPSSEHVVLWLTLLAIGFVALRILIVSRGDSDTLRALVQNLNVTAIVLATILPVVTTAVVLISVLAVVAGADQIRQPKPGKTRANGVASVVAALVVFGPPTVAVIWFAMPTKYIIVAAVLSGVFVVVYLGSWRGARSKDLFRAVAGLYLVFVLVAGLWVVIAQVGVWLPRERLAIGWWKTGTVYVLSSDEVWTKYLDDDAHRVLIVPTKNIASREAVASKDTWSNRTPSEIWARP